MITRKVVIFTAVQIETRAIARAMDGADPFSFQIYTVGIGAKRLPAGLERDGVVAIVMAGLAGAINPELNISDLVLEDAGQIVSSRDIRRGRIHSVDNIVATSVEKAELFRTTGAAVVDMENERVRKFAADLGIPFIGIRAISDIASETLDPAVMGMIDDVGRPRPLSIAAALGRRPRLIPYLKRLGDQSKLAAQQLGIAVRTIVDDLV